MTTTTTTTVETRKKDEDFLPVDPTILDDIFKCYGSNNKVGCEWCRRTYDCNNYTKVKKAILNARDYSHMLQILGKNGIKDINYLINTHPYPDSLNRCFFSTTLVDAVMSTLDSETKLRVYERGVCSTQTLENVIMNWIRTGKENEYTIEHIIKNANKVWIIYTMDNNTNVATMIRVAKYFRLIYQREQRQCSDSKMKKPEVEVQLVVYPDNLYRDIQFSIHTDRICVLLPRYCRYEDTEIEMDHCGLYVNLIKYLVYLLLEDFKVNVTCNMLHYNECRCIRLFKKIKGVYSR